MISNATHVEALFPFQSADKDRLSFEAGERIKVLARSDGGWWIGSTDDGRMGIFPMSYCVECFGGGGMLPSAPASGASSPRDGALGLMGSVGSSKFSRPKDAKVSFDVKAAPTGDVHPATTQGITASARGPPNPRNFGAELGFDDGDLRHGLSPNGQPDVEEPTRQIIRDVLLSRATLVAVTSEVSKLKAKKSELEKRQRRMELDVAEANKRLAERKAELVAETDLITRIETDLAVLAAIEDECSSGDAGAVDAAWQPEAVRERLASTPGSSLSAVRSDGSGSQVMSVAGGSAGGAPTRTARNAPLRGPELEEYLEQRMKDDRGRRIVKKFRKEMVALKEKSDELGRREEKLKAKLLAMQEKNDTARAAAMEREATLNTEGEKNVAALQARRDALAEQLRSLTEGNAIVEKDVHKMRKKLHKGNAVMTDTAAEMTLLSQQESLLTSQLADAKGELAAARTKAQDARDQIARAKAEADMKKAALTAECDRVQQTVAGMQEKVASLVQQLEALKAASGSGAAAAPPSGTANPAS